MHPFNGFRDNWEVWRNIAEDELTEQSGDMFFISGRVCIIMSTTEFKTSVEPREIQLARSTVSGLGFNRMPSTLDLFARIKEIGNLCPAKVGPRVRRIDKDQPYGTCYWIAMNPITGSHGGPFIFCVERNDEGERWLSASYAGPGPCWSLEDEIVFQLSR